MELDASTTARRRLTQPTPTTPGPTMQLTSWLPSRLRVGAQALLRQAQGLHSALTSAPRPVFQSRHTPDQLIALTERAHQAKVARVEAAQGTPQAGLRAAFRDLAVLEVQRPTPDALTLWLRDDPADPIRFRPGQFLTVVVPLAGGGVAGGGEEGGGEARRAYSLCSDPWEAEAHGRLALTIKRVPGGLVSNRLFDLFTGGAPPAHLRTLGPNGSFGLTPDPAQARHVVLVGAGSGITPLWSVAQAVLRAEPQSRVTLVYGSRSPDQTLFRAQIQALADASAGRLAVMMAYTQPPDGWSGPTGRLTDALLSDLLPIDPGAAYLLCGPADVEQAAQRLLARAHIQDVQVERFVAQRRATPTPSAETFAVRLARSGRLLLVPASQTLLEAGRAAGVPMPFSCTMGGCGACRVTKLSGVVDEEQPNCLTQKERAEGGCLTCVSRPRSALTLDL